MSTHQQVAIQFSCEATPLKTQDRIRRETAKALNEGRSQHYTPEWVEPLNVTEGAEKCGYGPLHIGGTVEFWNGHSTVRYAVENLGSQWKTYGAPTGCRHEVTIRLKIESARAPGNRATP